MPITVNSNIASLNAQRNLSSSANALGKSLERLSSGLRINRAGDDAAGLAISEGLRSQIRGLNQAVRNANDGLSLVSVAESVIGSYTDNLQRIRELAIQSANDTNSASNRASLEEEAQQLLDELARIASTVSFNGLKLLDGSFTSKQLQVGANVNETIAIDTGDLRTTSIGAVATTTTGAVSAALGAGDLLLNGVDVGATAPDGVSFANQNASAIAIAHAINAVSGTSRVTAQVASTQVVGLSAVQGVSLDGTTSTLLINGVNIGAVVVTGNDSDGALRDRINQVSNSTGVTASLNSSNELILTAADGRNITTTTTGSVADELGLAAANGDVTGLTTGGTITLTSDSAFAVGGTSPADAGLSATTVAIDLATALNSLTIVNVTGANSAIVTVDNALRQANQIRASLGAITNRLEHTIQNLQATAENYSASDSRIRDADFAYETANLTKNQILQQAGVAILAQANSSTQAALSLLQR